MLVEWVKDYPTSQNTPKPLVKVSDKILIDLIIEFFLKYGFSVFFFGLNYKKLS